LKPIDIILIDDEEGFLNAIEHFLTKHGASVVKAKTVKEGLAHLREKKFDLLLLDLVLPDENGINVLKYAKDPDNKIAQVNKKMKTIVLTANANTEVVLEALQLGAFDCLSKPFELKLLEEKINIMFK